jgi:hypothetical protein
LSPALVARCAAAFGCSYDTVLDACELRRDLAQLPQGDLTLIGDR